METRSIVIGLVAVVAAFAAAFGVAKSGGSKTATAGAGVKAESIKVAAPPAVAGVEVGATLPSLKAERKKAPAKKKKSSSSNSNSSPSTTNSTPSTPAPSNPQPSSPAPSNPQPSNPAPSNPQPSNPAPSNPQPSDPGPVAGGGEDG